jgi:antitoxin ParD1/3/4
VVAFPYRRLLMSDVETVNVALTADLVALLNKAVESGEYESTSEVVREALRGWKARRMVDELEVEELRRLWNEGVNSGEPIDAEAVFQRLEDRYGLKARG